MLSSGVLRGGETKRPEESENPETLPPPGKEKPLPFEKELRPK